MLDISLKQMRYAVEIAQCGSINQAAQNRNERLAAMKISIPRATYITYAFTEFFKEIQNQEQIQINFSETNSQEAVDNILNHGFQLGIIRYPEFLEESNRQLLHQKHLRVKPIWTFTYRLLVSRESVLATKELIAPEELAGFTELVHGDEQTFLPEAAGVEQKRIYLYERGSQFDFLSNVPQTYIGSLPCRKKCCGSMGWFRFPARKTAIATRMCSFTMRTIL